MECKNCYGRWEPGQNSLKIPVTCPFCGVDLVDADDSRPDRYDNPKDVLAAIMREHGAEVLLGSKLKNFFNDYAPGMKGAQKKAVSLVYDSGAAEILKKNLGAGAEEQEIAFRRAVQKMVDEYPVERSRAESIILEFTAALGWKINIQRQKPLGEPLKEKQRQSSSTQKKQQTQSTPMKLAEQNKNGAMMGFMGMNMVSQAASISQKKQQTPLVQATGNLTPGQRNVKFGKYLWRVLDVQNGKALLLSEEILERRSYHTRKATTWEKCKLREYLNGEFLQSFSRQEQSRIAQTKNTNEDNPWYRTRGGGSTTDKVFLLSIEEVVKYFEDSGDLRARKGWYWKDGEGEYVLRNGKGGYINDQYNSARKVNYGNERAWWWLRSCGFTGFQAAYVDYGGPLDVYGFDVYSEEGGVRPALWLNLNIQQQSPPVQQNPPAPVQATGNLTPGQRNVPFGKYLWRVLDVQNGKALLLAEEILEQRRYHSEYRSVTWEDCELRKYLNGEFLRTFSSREQERIAQTQNTNKDNQWYGTSGGRSTVDRVFLLSIEEAVKYFGNSGDLRARKGWYWGYSKWVLKDGKGDIINDQYNSARIAKYKGETRWWWLRSPGYDVSRTAYVYGDGAFGVGGGLDMGGPDVTYASGGVRPALWLNL